MKKIIKCDLFSRDYNIGDVVYLAKSFGKISCKALAVSNINGEWAFKPLQECSCYKVSDGIIHFRCKPFIFAKEVEIKEEQQ